MTSVVWWVQLPLSGIKRRWPFLLRNEIEKLETDTTVYHSQYRTYLRGFFYALWNFPDDSITVNGAIHANNSIRQLLGEGVTLARLYKQRAIHGQGFGGVAC